MSSTSFHRMIAGAAVRDLGANAADVEAVDVDGENITDIAGAQAYLQAHESLDSRSKVAHEIDDRLFGGKPKPKTGKKKNPHFERAKTIVVALQKRVMATKAGQYAQKALNTTPEHVSYEATAKVRMRDGSVRTLDVKVDDKLRSMMLARTVLLTEIFCELPLPVPFVGGIVPTIIGVFMLGVAGVTKLQGNDQYAKALVNTAAKQAALGAANMFFGVSHALTTMTFFSDREKAKALLSA